jgi:hypothetical protein
MLTSAQIMILREFNVKGIFIHPNRFDGHGKELIPKEPYYVAGIFKNKLPCIPFSTEATNAYLNAIHTFKYTEWNGLVSSVNVYTWRDGESIFFLPNSIERENLWLESESNNIKRSFIENTDILNINDDRKCSYPIHSFKSWVENMKVYWFINRISHIENNIQDMDYAKIMLWLQLINSDILSSIEKKNPIINIKLNKNETKEKSYMIKRQEKLSKGEELLYLLESNFSLLDNINKKYQNRFNLLISNVM